MTWVVIQATTPRDAYWKLAQAFLAAPDENLRSRGQFYILNNLVMEIAQPGVGDLNLADGHFTINRWRKYLSDYTDSFFPEFLDQCLGTKKHREEGYSCPVRGQHTHGNCLMGVTFSDSMELTLFSRVTQVHPTSVLDLCFGSAVARYLETSLREKVTLNWVIRAANADHRRCMAQLEYHDSWHLVDRPNPNRFVQQLQVNQEVLQRDPDFLFNLSYNGYRILGKALRRKRAGTTREKIIPELILKDRGTT